MLVLKRDPWWIELREGIRWHFGVWICVWDGAVAEGGLGGHAGFTHSEVFVQLQMARFPTAWLVESWSVTHRSLIWRIWEPGPLEWKPKNPK